MVVQWGRLSTMAHQLMASQVLERVRQRKAMIIKIDDVFHCGVLGEVSFVMSG